MEALAERTQVKRISDRFTQKGRLRELFRSRPLQRVSLPTILSMGIAQYNARLFELRSEGMNIESITERVDGVTHSWFMYKPNVMDSTGQSSFLPVEKGLSQ